MLCNGPISSKSNLSRGNNQDGDLVSSKCIQTLDGRCYAIQSYIAGDRLRSIETRIKKLAVGSANFSVVEIAVVEAIYVRRRPTRTCAGGLNRRRQ